MLNVVCLKVGPKYGASYVRALQNGFRKHLTIPHRFICLTDDPTGLDCEWFKEDTGLPGWWGKIGLFRKEVPGLHGRILFSDLDNLIVGNIDEMVAYEGDLVSVEDFSHPRQFNSAFFMLEIGSNVRVWDEFAAQGDVHRRRNYGDQDWITPRIPQWEPLWPQDWVVSYKWQALGGPPKGSRVVCFHGKKKQPECSGWARQQWERLQYA